MAVDPVSDPTQLQVIAQPNDAELTPSQSNPALQLADALKEASPEVSDALGAYGGFLKAKAQQQAQADAFKSSGAKFADAVRAGSIQPTQNPWYIKAYNESAAKLTARSQIDAAVSASLTAPEHGDLTGQSYQQLLSQKIGEIGQQFTTKDGQLGFNEIAQPLLSDALSNHETYAAQTIMQQQVQNTTSLGSQALMDTLKKSPGADAQTLFQAMEPEHKQWLATGGTESSWRLIAIQSFRGAASNLLDPTLLDRLSEPYLGGNPLANQADETGKPVAEQLIQDRRYIDFAQEAANNNAMRAYNAQVTADGIKVEQWATTKYGNDLADGKISQAQFRQDAEGEGFSGAAVNFAMAKQAEGIRGAAGFSQAQTDLYSTSPEGQKAIVKVNQLAVTEGLTPGLIGQLNDMVLHQQITAPMAEQIMDRAQGQSHFAVGEANANRREAEGLARTDASLALQRSSMVGDGVKSSIGKGQQFLIGAGVDPGHFDARTKASYEAAVSSAGYANVDKGPIAASEASDAAALHWSQTYLATHKRATGAPALQGNPNR